MHPNYCQITILLVVDLCSLLVYFMMTHPFPIAGKSPVKTLVARQLPTHTHTYFHLLLTWPPMSKKLPSLPTWHGKGRSACAASDAACHVYRALPDPIGLYQISRHRAGVRTTQ